MRDLSDRDFVRMAANVGGRVNATAVAAMLPMRRVAAVQYLQIVRACPAQWSTVPDPHLISWLTADPSWSTNTELLSEVDAADQRRQLDYIAQWAGAQFRDDAEHRADERFREAMLTAISRCEVRVYGHNLTDRLDTAPAFAEEQLRRMLNRLFGVTPIGPPVEFADYIKSWTPAATGFKQTGEAGIERRLIDPYDALEFSPDTMTNQGQTNEQQ